jgi:very-short-patch-repair endonuclease
MGVPIAVTRLDDRERMASQLRIWRERLIDPSRGNPLLGINRARTSKLRAASPAASQLFDAMVLDGKKLRLPLVYRGPLRQAAEVSIDGDAEPVWRVREGDIRFEAEPTDIYRRLRRIRDNARTTIEERGVTTLHLTIGAVSWDDALLGPSVAPLWLIPCALENTGPDDPLLLVATEEEPQANPALALFLRERYKKVLPPLPDEPAPGVILDLLEQTQALLGAEWQIADEAWLSTFSFETLTLYQDLDPDKVLEAALASDVIRGFAGLSVTVEPERSERLGDDLDMLPTPQVVPTPALPADSSQLEALTYAHAGRHVLIYGPPGTGKSQTIANLIADAIGQGKTVLFVSAKKAALDVVFDRLTKLGLDRFCLEAHSTKAGKGRVIDELRRTLEAADQTREANSHAELVRFITIREMLNEYVRELHRPREPLGRSVYEALGSYARLNDVPAVSCPLPWKDLKTITQATLDGVIDSLRDLQSHASVFRERETHPWRGCRVPIASYAALEILTAALQLAQAVWTEIIELSSRLEPFVGGLTDRSLKDLEDATAGFQALQTATWLPEGWTAKPLSEIEAATLALTTAAEKSKALRDARERFRELAGEADPIDALPMLAPALERFDAWYKRMLPPYFAWKRHVQKHLALQSSSFEDITRLARLSREIADIADWLQQREQDLSLLLGSATKQFTAEALQDAASAYGAAATLRHGRVRLGALASAPRPTVVGPEVRAAAIALLGRLPTHHAELSDALGKIDDAWGGHFVDSLGAQETPAAAGVARCEEPLRSPNRLTEWVNLYQATERCRAQGLGPFIKALAPYGTETAINIFGRRFLRLWIDEQITGTPALAHFKGLSRESLVQEFANLDHSLRKADVATVADNAARRAAQINQTGYVARDSQLGILRRELQRRRPRPLRRLFADIPQVLQAIKPCMLMSPVSVSTYLALDRMSFDVVVFDEASQLPPPEAIPAILRARQVIVAGDDKQLPPTSFFSSSLFSEENDDGDDDTKEVLESLLHDCQATVPLLQPAWLRWHYRSKDERLIAFSNRAFYEGSLITFPSPGSPQDRGVQLHYVTDGVWDRGGSRTNRTEARAVAQLVIQQLDAHPERSIGVVALNVSQKEAIEDALEEVLLLRADLREQLGAEGDEPFFIKSLENVQGDQRDTIIISVGYGRDASGTVHLNFGPLNREGGWRRLNVLVTRAKYLTLLVTSLRSTDLGAVAPDNRGATSLRQFIEYAERGGRHAPESARLTGAETNDFEDAIATALRARGLVIDEQVGASSFRIDLAVRDPRDLNWYLLGIECDGATYHSSRAARDRDLLRAEVLREMGWKLHRIWSVDWFRDPDEIVDHTMRAVQRAMGQGDPVTGVAAPPPVLPPLPQSPAPIPPPLAPRGPTYSPGLPYQRTPQERSLRELLLDPHQTEQLVSEVVRVVKAETPIHEDLVLIRLKTLHDIGRAGSNIVANYRTALDRAVQRRLVRRDKRGFLWTDPDTLAAFRVPSLAGDRPGIAYIPPEEIRLAVLHVVESQFGVPRESLLSATGRALGFDKPSSDTKDVIGEVVDTLIEKGELVVRGFQIELP